MAANQKDYKSYKFELRAAVDDGSYFIYLELTQADADKKWKCFRHLVSIGARLEGYLGEGRVPTSTSFYQTRHHQDTVTLAMQSMSSKERTEEALHSLYLFMEHPEKFA